MPTLIWHACHLVAVPQRCSADLQWWSLQMEGTDGLFALARCPMGLFVFLNLLTEKELRLACWETAAGRKSPKFLCISQRINKDQGICCKQRKPRDLRAFWLCCGLPAWLWRRCQWWDSSDWKCVSTNIRGNRQKIILSVFLWVWCANPTELRENQTLKGPVSLHWLQYSPWENQLTWRPLSWRSLTLEKLTSSFCCLQWKYPHMTVLKTANGL